jgi:hypothetical protein
MERPQVQIVEYPQEEISNSHIPEFEKNNLLAKYGYKKNFQSDEDCVVNTKSNLTFEEMVALEEKKLEFLIKNYQVRIDQIIKYVTNVELFSEESNDIIIKCFFINLKILFIFIL